MKQECTNSETRTSEALLREFVEGVERAGFTIEISDPESFYSMTPEQTVEFAEKFLAKINEVAA